MSCYASQKYNISLYLKAYNVQHRYAMENTCFIIGRYAVVIANSVRGNWKSQTSLE